MILNKFLGNCCGPVSQRFVIATAVHSGLALQLIHRLAFHLFLATRTRTVTVDYNDLTTTCNFVFGNKSVIIVGSPNKVGFLGTTEEITLMISAYYAGNFITLLIGRYIIQKIGLKRIFFVGVFINAIGSMLTPLGAEIGLHVLVPLRVIMGLGHGPLLLTDTLFSYRWSLYRERFMFSTLIQSSTIIGGIIGFGATGVMLHNFEDWRTIFYFYAVISFLWCILWIVFIHDSVDNHPYISERERRKISHDYRIRETFQEYDITMGSLFKSVPFWALSIIKFGNGWIFYFIINLLPLYMTRVLIFNAREVGLLCTLPFATMSLFSLCLGQLSKSIISKGYMLQKTMLKLYPILGAIFSSIFMLGASYAGCSRLYAVLCFSLSMAFLGLEYHSLQIFYSRDVAISNVTIVQAISNSIRTLGGVLVPVVFTVFTPTDRVQSLLGWRHGFIFSSILVLISAVIYFIWGAGDIKDWHYALRIPQVLDGQSSDKRRTKDKSTFQTPVDPSQTSFELSNTGNQVTS